MWTSIVLVVGSLSPACPVVLKSVISVAVKSEKRIEIGEGCPMMLLLLLLVMMIVMTMTTMMMTTWPIWWRLIVNVQIVREEQLSKMRERGVIASIQPQFVSSDARWLSSKLPQQLIDCAYPWKSLLRAGYAMLCNVHTAQCAMCNVQCAQLQCYAMWPFIMWTRRAHFVTGRYGSFR